MHRSVALPLSLVAAWLFACSQGEVAASSAAQASATDSANDSASAVSSASAPSATASGLASASAPPSATAEPPADPLSADALMEPVRWMASPDLHGRRAGTDDERRVAAHLAKLLDDASIPPAFGVRTQSFDFQSNAETKSSANILALISPPGGDTKDVVVLGAHYDHLGERGAEMFPGAEDNASGTSVVLGVARALMRRRAELGRSVLVVFFGAEEEGLLGSKSFVRTWSFQDHPVTTMVNVDMIGRPLADQRGLWWGAHAMGILPDVDPDSAVGVVFSEPLPEDLLTIVRDACKKEKLSSVALVDLPPSIRQTVAAMTKGRGDDAAFAANGVKTVFFSSGESDDYHKPTDTADTLDPTLMATRARAILTTVLAVAKR
ncbi:MAG: M28 family peptidase [Polyangiaceae bacterium]